VPTHSADRSSSQVAAVAAALGDELAASGPELPGLSAAGNGDLITTAAGNFPVTGDDADDFIRKAPGVTGAYIYGCDSAENPALTGAGYSCSSYRKLPG
jgi:hypothetical protein